MKHIQLSDVDATTVMGILMTHAEMQDARSVNNLQSVAILKQEHPDDPDATEYAQMLQDDARSIDDDVTNIRRIAGTFGNT